MTTEQAVKEFEAQGAIAPGTAGWWQVWGAHPHNIRTGDIIMSKSGDEVITEYVEETFTAKAHPLRVGYIANGERRTIGALVPIILMRRDTHHTLA